MNDMDAEKAKGFIEEAPEDFLEMQMRADEAFALEYGKALGYLAALAGPEVRELVAALRYGFDAYAVGQINTPSKALGLLTEMIGVQFKALDRFQKHFTPDISEGNPKGEERA